jgi:hypothetical protein
MNERIKELAEQAGASYYNTYTGPLLSPKDIEKFAELIVAECCKQIMYSSVGQEDPVFAYEYINHLRSTFGVKP